MRDVEIRHELLVGLRRRFPGDRIRNEMGLCLGETRVDVAVINGHLHGFEIKSERDRLDRLPSQVALYGKVLDFATVVIGAKHFDHVDSLIPEWWGIVRAKSVGEAIELEEVRRPTVNPGPDPFSIAQLLWRDEAAEALRMHGEAVHRRETRWQVWDRLATLDLSDLQTTVRELLKARQIWPGG